MNVEGQEGGENSESGTDSLVAELRMLRRGRGASLLKLTASSLYPLLSSDGDDVRAAFSRRLAALGSGEQARALVAAFNVDGQLRDKLVERRNDFAVDVGKHPDTIENYENSMIDELAAMLRLELSTPSDDKELREKLEDEDQLVEFLKRFVRWAQERHPPPDEDDPERLRLEKEYEAASERLWTLQKELLNRERAGLPEIGEDEPEIVQVNIERDFYKRIYDEASELTLLLLAYSTARDELERYIRETGSGPHIGEVLLAMDEILTEMGFEASEEP